MLDFEKINEVLLRRKNKVLFPTYIEDTMPDCSITDVVNIFSSLNPEAKLSTSVQKCPSIIGLFSSLLASLLYKREVSFICM